MKRTLIGLVLAACTLGPALPASAQFGKKQQEPQIRRVSGKVLDANDAPVKDAVIYLKNMKTLAIKTLISESNGGYSFMELSPNVDYQVWAEANGHKSSPKTISSFDGRSQFNFDLKLK